MTSIIINFILPEIFLGLCILFQLVFNTVLLKANRKDNAFICDIAFIQSIVILIITLYLYYINPVFGGIAIKSFCFYIDDGIVIAKMIFVVIALLVLPLVHLGLTNQKIHFHEFYSLYNLAILSFLLLIFSADFVLSFLLLESSSLCFYTFLALRKSSFNVIQSSLFYFIVTVFMTIMFLIGCVVFYFNLGSVNFSDFFFIFSEDLKYNEYQSGILIVGAIFISAYFLFKFGVAPFYRWYPDIFESAPISITTAYSALSKYPIYLFALKFFLATNQNFTTMGSILTLLFCVFNVYETSITNVAQNRIKRLYLFSTNNQGGFLVSCLCIGTENGNTYGLFFVLLYITASIHSWACLMMLSSVNPNKKSDYIVPLSLTDLNIILKDKNASVLLKFTLYFLFFGLAGIPPIATFLSKLFVMKMLIEIGTSLCYIAASSLLISTLISAFVYMRPVKINASEPITSKEAVSVIAGVDNLIKPKGLIIFAIGTVIAFTTFVLMIFLFYSSDLLNLCHYVVQSCKQF